MVKEENWMVKEIKYIECQLICDRMVTEIWMIGYRKCDGIVIEIWLNG